MIIRVDYSDNDFQAAVREACEKVLYEITDEYPAGSESIERFEEYLAEHDTENLRQRIVLAATGLHITFKGARGRFVKYNDSLATFDEILQYLDEKVKVSLVEAVGTEWENGEVCFIDLWTKEVTVC